MRTVRIVKVGERFAILDVETGMCLDNCDEFTCPADKVVDAMHVFSSEGEADNFALDNRHGRWNVDMEL